MPALHRSLPHLELVVIRLSGLITETHFIEGQRQLQDDPLFRRDFRQFLDARDVSSFELHGGAVRQLSSRSAFTPGTARAIVAPNSAIYGIARMFEAYAYLNHQQVRVFRDVAEACTWLDVAVEDVERELGALRKQSPDPARALR